MTRAEALKILGFAPDANPSEKDIKWAWRTISKPYHPDSTSGLADRDEFEKITAAKDFLEPTAADEALDREVTALVKKHIDWAIDQITANRRDAANNIPGVPRRASSAVSHFRRIGDALDHVLTLLRVDTQRYQLEYAEETFKTETFKQLLHHLAVEPPTTFNRLAREQVESRLRIAENEMALYIRTNNVAVAVIDLVEKHRQELAANQRAH